LSRVMPSRTHTRKAATTQIKAGNQPRKKWRQEAVAAS
jgi:hypothetical protein